MHQLYELPGGDLCLQEIPKRTKKPMKKEENIYNQDQELFIWGRSGPEPFQQYLENKKKFAV